MLLKNSLMNDWTKSLNFWCSLPKQPVKILYRDFPPRKVSVIFLLAWLSFMCPRFWESLLLLVTLLSLLMSVPYNIGLSGVCPKSKSLSTVVPRSTFAPGDIPVTNHWLGGIPMPFSPVVWSKASMEIWYIDVSPEMVPSKCSTASPKPVNVTCHWVILHKMMVMCF